MKYLDDRPIFDDERRVTEAWAKGGRDAEIEERQKIKDEKNKKNTQTVEEIRKKNEEIRGKRRILFENAQKQSQLEKERLLLELDKAKEEGKSEGNNRCAKYYITINRKRVLGELKNQKIFCKFVMSL